MMGGLAAWLSELPFGVTDAAWTILIGSLCSVSCALLGCFLVLRRLSLIGDAISHAVLPGLVIGLLMTGGRNPLPMFLGALVFGMLTAFLTEVTHKAGNVPTDSAMGVVFAALFAWGVLLITRKASAIDIDPDCVLFGQIVLSVFDTVTVGSVHVPRVVLSLGGIMALVLLFVVLLWKELKISAFDPELATTMGLSAGLMHYALMGMVALSTVASFEAVGAILVIAMLVVPGATAQLLTDKLSRMLPIAAGLSVLASAAGYFGAKWLNTEVAGMIAVMLGIEFALVALFAPRHGVLGRIFGRIRLARRIMGEDMLGELWRLGERGEPATVGRTALAQGRQYAGGAMRSLMRRGLIRAEGENMTLTESGAAQAAHFVRAHRLWETYLTREVDEAERDVHGRAHSIEHFVSREMAERLSTELDEPQKDPHGSEIPK